MADERPESDETAGQSDDFDRPYWPIDADEQMGRSKLRGWLNRLLAVVLLVAFIAFIVWTSDTTAPRIFIR